MATGSHPISIPSKTIVGTRWAWQHVPVMPTFRRQAGPESEGSLGFSVLKYKNGQNIIHLNVDSQFTEQHWVWDQSSEGSVLMKMICAQDFIWGHESEAGAHAEAEAGEGERRWRGQMRSVLCRFQSFRDPCLLRPTLNSQEPL